MGRILAQIFELPLSASSQPTGKTVTLSNQDPIIHILPNLFHRAVKDECYLRVRRPAMQLHHITDAFTAFPRAGQFVRSDRGSSKLQLRLWPQAKLRRRRTVRYPTSVMAHQPAKSVLRCATLTLAARQRSFLIKIGVFDRIFIHAPQSPHIAAHPLSTVRATLQRCCFLLSSNFRVCRSACRILQNRMCVRQSPISNLQVRHLHTSSNTTLRPSATGSSRKWGT